MRSARKGIRDSARRCLQEAIDGFRRGLGAAHAGRPGDDQHGAEPRLHRAGPRRFKNFADWTDRIAKGEVPFAKPQRPQGIERNVVVTMWDWSTPKHYLHDGISTDKRKPTRQRQRPDLRVARGEHRQRAGARSGQAHARARSSIRIAIRSTPSSTRLAAAAVGLLGRGADLGRPHQHPQRDDG